MAAPAMHSPTPPQRINKKPAKLLRSLGAIHAAVKSETEAIDKRTDVTTQEIEFDAYRMLGDRIIHAVSLGSFIMEDDEDPAIAFPRITRTFKVCAFDDSRLQAKCERRFNTNELPRSIALRVARSVAEELPVSGFEGRILDDGYNVTLVVARRLPSALATTDQHHHRVIVVIEAEQVPLPAAATTSSRVVSWQPDAAATTAVAAALQEDVMESF